MPEGGLSHSNITRNSIASPAQCREKELGKVPGLRGHTDLSGRDTPTCGDTKLPGDTDPGKRDQRAQGGAGSGMGWRAGKAGIQRGRNSCYEKAQPEGERGRARSEGARASLRERAGAEEKEEDERQGRG